MTAALFLVAIAMGIVALVWGATRFIDGAAGIATHLGVSPLIIGVTIVGFGTSVPEMLVSALASFAGSPALGIGNAIGSNIANIGLVFGMTALMMPIIVPSAVLSREFPLLALVTVLVCLLIIDEHLSRWDGVLLFAGFIAVLIGMTMLAVRSNRSGLDQCKDYAPLTLTIQRAGSYFVVGLLTLLVASKALIWGATGIAKLLGVSDLVIGLSIVAVGTSLPELATALASVWKRKDDIAVGSILGSNIFNMLAVLAMPGLIKPGYLGAGVLSRDFVVMTFLFVLAYLFVRTNRRHLMSRWAGFVMLSAYIIYIVSLVYSQNTDGIIG